MNPKKAAAIARELVTDAEYRLGKADTGKTDEQVFIVLEHLIEAVRLLPNVVGTLPEQVTP